MIFSPIEILLVEDDPGDAAEDIVKSYELGCNCYVTKPVGLDQFSNVIQTIESFWFTIVKLPSNA